MKKGQVTWFILIGVIILIAVLFISHRPVLKTQINTQTPIGSAMFDICLENSLRQALGITGLYGGEYPAGKNIGGTIRPYSDEGQPNPLPLETLENSITYSTNEIFKECVQSIRDHMPKGIEINEDSRVTLLIGEREVSATAEGITVDTEGTSTRDHASAIVPSRILDKYRFATELLQTYQKDPDWAPISEIEDLSQKYNVTVESTTINTTVFYSIHDTLIQGSDQPYLFAIRFRWEK